MSGKGSRQRPSSVSQKTFDSNWDMIFNKEKDMQVRFQKNKNDIGLCGCGRSPTGRCIGWHALSETAYKKKLQEYKENEKIKGS